MNSTVNTKLYYIDELLPTFRTSGEEAIGMHLTDDEFVQYSTRALSDVEEDAIDAHLAACPDCARRLEHLLSESRSWESDNGRQRLNAFSQALLGELLGKPNALVGEEADDIAASEDQDEQLNLRLRTQDELDVITLLGDLDVIEKDYDYVLPSGLHCDTYINTGKLCRSEHGLRQIARAFSALFSDVTFDVVVCSGWAMGMIGRRVARELAIDSDRQIRIIVVEGYSSLSFTEDVFADARVLILTDVSITGQLSARLRTQIYRYGAIVVGAGCLVVPSDCAQTSVAHVRSLCAVDMVINNPSQGCCPRCAVLRKLVFNPISSQMTVKKLEPRSPTQFLAEFPEAGTFWEAVNTARAYEHHHVEDKTHYIAFVNTAKMLRHATVGRQIVSALMRLVTADGTIPDVVLLPNRIRARLLASAIVESFEERLQGRSLQIAYAQPRGGAWRIGKGGQQHLSDANVLILDTATGHGGVLDELSLLAADCGARSVSAAVLLSRLTLSCEEAFRGRLNGRFFRLFHLPIRPVAIRTNDRSLCPVCHQRELIQRAANEKREEALVQLARQTASVNRRPHSVDGEDPHSRQYAQRLLFEVPDPPLLHRCRRAVASGITLHALHTAMTDGMAPLALPELRNAEIPRENRVAMLENLPPGIFEWGGDFLAQSVEVILADGGEESVWIASADILAREGRSYWVPYLKGLLERSANLREKPHCTFWNRLAYGAYRLSSQDADLREEMRDMVQELLDAYRATIPESGLRRVVDVLTDSGDARR